VNSGGRNRLFVAFTVGVSVVVVVGLLPLHNWIVDLMANLRLHAGAVALILAGAAFRARRKGFAALLVTTVAVVVIDEWRYSTALPPNGTRNFAAISYNLKLDAVRAGAANDFLADSGADVIFLQEVSPGWLPAIESLRSGYAHRLVLARQDSFGIAILSRLPLMQTEVNRLPGDVPFLSATIDIDGRRIALVTAHLEWPVTPASYHRRNSQIEILGRYLAGARREMLVCGDFNLTPQSRWYAHFESLSGLEGIPGGYRLRGSWPSSLPGARIAIDHCFTSAGLSILDYSIGPSLGSDHVPLRVEMSAATR